MLYRLLLLFILVPLAELLLLLLLADKTSWQFTFGLIVVTGIVGTLLTRAEGYRVWRRIQGELAAGRVPGEALVDGAMVVAAGALLLTPGVLTDLFGISLLLPFCRGFYRRVLVRWFQSRVVVRTRSNWTEGQAEAGTQPRQTRIIDSYTVPSPEEPQSKSEERP